MVKRRGHVGRVAERFNGDNRIIPPLEAVLTLQQHPRPRKLQARQYLLGNSLLRIAQRITIDCESRGLARHEDGETPIAASGIGDEPGPRLVHPPERFAKLDEWVLI